MSRTLCPGVVLAISGAQTTLAELGAMLGGFAEQAKKANASGVSLARFLGSFRHGQSATQEMTT
jgi:hypothetical protein